MLLGNRGPHKQGGKGRTPLLKGCYSTAIGPSNVKMVADRHRYALIITSTGNELLRNVNIGDLE